MRLRSGSQLLHSEPRPGWQLIASQDTQESAHEIVGFRAIRILVDSTTFMTTETVFKIFLARCGRIAHFECLPKNKRLQLQRDGERRREASEKGMVHACFDTIVEARL